MDLSSKPKKDALKKIRELDDNIKKQVKKIEIFKGASFEKIKFSYRGEPYYLNKVWDDIIRKAVIEHIKKKIKDSIQELEGLIPEYEPDEEVKKILDE